MEKEYKVAGNNSVFGFMPGQTFRRDLSEFDETRLIEGGALALVTSKPSTPPPVEGSTPKTPPIRSGSGKE